MNSTSTLRCLVLAAMCAALVACGERDASAPPASPFHAIDITGAAWGHDFHLTDHLGRPRSLGDFKGQVVLIFFGYTHCPDMCPTTLAQLAQLRAKLGQDAPRVQGLFVTLDPKRDTPAVLAQYVPAFDASFLGLYADEKTTAEVTRDFKIFFSPQKPDPQGHYTVDHSGGVFVFDAQGRLRLMLRPGSTVDEMAADVKRLISS